MTVDNPPLIQAGRLDDYSPEYWALTAGKGAAVLNMLRSVIGADNFNKLMTSFPEKYGWQSVSTVDFRKMAEEISGQNLQYFFVQWLESSGAPEFKMEYTVFRTQKGFRVMGKISQDLDTFQMPVDLKIETEGNPETKRIDVVGTSSEFTVDTFGKPKTVTIDPGGYVLRWNPDHAHGGGHQTRRAVRRNRRVRRCAQGISEGHRSEPRQFARALSRRRSFLPAEQLSVGGE